MRKTLRAAGGWSCLAFASWLSLQCVAQQPSPPATADASQQLDPSKIKTVEDARAALREAEDKHPGNTPQVVEALVWIAMLEEDRGPTEDTLQTAKRAVAVAEAAKGKESALYAEALAAEARVLVGLDRPQLGRPLAEEALGVAQRTAADGGDIAGAASALSYACHKELDTACALRSTESAVKFTRAQKDLNPVYLASDLINLVDLRRESGDMPGARAALEEALAIADKQAKVEPQWAIIETDAGAFYLHAGEYDRALECTKKGLEMSVELYGADSVEVGHSLGNLANIELRVGKGEESIKDFARQREIFIKRYGANSSRTARASAGYMGALEVTGRFPEAMDLALLEHKAMREYVRLAIKLMPERQALALSNEATMSLDFALTVVARHKEIQTADVYQEVVRSRALVAEEMAQRAASLSRKHDPAVEQLEKDLETERKAVMESQGAAADANSAAALSDVTAKMEKTEQELAARSAAYRTDERVRSSDLADLRKNMPPGSVLISYVGFNRYAPSEGSFTAPWVHTYLAFVLHRDSDRIGVYELSEGKKVIALVKKMRATADAEAHGGGLGSARNERDYRETAEELRKIIWDPLQEEIGSAKLALVVTDGILNLVPFAALPEGSGYMVEHGPVVHMLTSERDLVPVEQDEKRSGLLAVGNPSFEVARVDAPPASLRDAQIKCDAFSKLEFDPLPGSLKEVNDISSIWQRWDANEPQHLLIGDNATRKEFLDAAPHSRILHVATHAFVLDRSCGNGNPLLHSGLVFAGANKDRDASILTAQQIASLDLHGVDWAVLSACNTGNGELKDGEGVLGLQRSFRVAGAKSVIMTLWPVDDEVAGHYMHVLYAERFGAHQTTADAVWNAARKLLEERRAAGQSTHPWYWAGFVGAGGWK